MEKIKCTCTFEDDVLTCVISGEIDQHTAKPLREKLDAKEQELHELRAEMEAQGEQGADAAAARTMMSRINKAVETLENAAEKLRKK